MHDAIPVKPWVLSLFVAVLLAAFVVLGRETLVYYETGKRMCRHYVPYMKTWECVLYDPWTLKFENAERALQDGKRK